MLVRVLGDSAIVIPENKRKTIIKKGRFDIRIMYKGIEFVIEASYDRTDAENDAKARLNTGLINTIAFALYYDPNYFEDKNSPDEIEETLLHTNLNLKILVPGDDINKTLLRYLYNSKKLPVKNVGDWISIELSNFGVFLDSTLEFLINEDILNKIINDIELKTKDFIDAMNDFIKLNPNSSITKDLNILLFTPRGSTEEQNVDSDIVFANTYISLLIASILYDSIINAYSMRSLGEILNKNNNDPYLTLKEAFEKVVKEIDYEQILSIALELIRKLDKVKNDQRINDIVRDIINITSNIISNKVILRQDFIGRLYHKVTGDIASRKGYATFYTKPQIAVLLSTLVFYSKPQWDIDWSDINQLKEFKICDFACGSGTLLSASYNMIFSLYRDKIMSTPNIDIDVKDFHKAIVENSIYGYDALEHAVQIASAVLALHNPEVPLEKMNTYHIPIFRGSLGSLNLLRATPLDQHNVGLTISTDNNYIPITKFNLIIMNPPFSRSTAPGKAGSRPSIFGFITNKNEYKILWKEYRKLINDIVLSPTNNSNKKIQGVIEKIIENGKLSKKAINPLNAGASLPFIFLADQYLKNDGKLAFVLPRSFLSNSSYLYARILILNEYNIDYIIFSSEDNNHNFSYSTESSEILLILSKKAFHRVNNNTKIINLKKQPKNILDGFILANSILSNEKYIKSLTGEAEISEISEDFIKDNVINWGILVEIPVDQSNNLKKLIDELNKNKIFGIKSVFIKIKDLHNVKIINPRKFRGNTFQKNLIKESDSDLKILISSGKIVLSKLEIQNLEFNINVINVRLKDGTTSDLINRFSSNILITETISFKSYPLIAIYSEVSMISTVAFMLKIDSDDFIFKKGIVAWLNSIFIIVYLKSKFSIMDENYGHIRSYSIENIPIPEDKRIIKCFFKVFEKYKDFEWPTLAEQLEDAIKNNNSLRLNFDLDILRAFSGNLPENAILELRKIYSEFKQLLGS
ncbi:MAG: hypothetical protein QXO65_03015 [Candidatus Aenigmatarchaeota archaeon]